MDEDEEYIDRNWLFDKMELHAAGKKVVELLDVVRRAWHRHIDRYRLWDQTFYRIYTWVVVIVLGLLLTAISHFSSQMYRHHEEVRAQTKAQAYLAQHDYRNASLSAARALLFNPNNVPACRVMATLADQSNSPAVLDWLGRVVHSEPTLDNKLQLATAGLTYQAPPFPFTSHLLEELEPTASNSVGYQLIAAKLAMSLHHFGDAKAHFASASRLAPDNLYARMSVALLQLLSTNQTERAEGQSVLEEMRTNGGLGLFALRGLVADQLVRGDLLWARFYSRELAANPRATLADILQDLGILHQLYDADFSPRLHAVEEQVVTNEQAVAEVSTWMRANGLTEENLQWMMTMPNSMLDRPLIQINRSQGYLQLGNWARLREVASQGDWGNLEYLRFALVSHACSELDARELADSNWQAAMKDASSHLADMIKLLELAESWHLNHEREEVLLWMVRDFPDDRWAGQLVGIYRSAGNTLGLHQLYGILNQEYPTNTLIMNDLATTEILLKINLNEAIQLSNEAYFKNPHNPMVAAIYAYILHLQDRDLQGIDVLKDLATADLQDPRVALYYGVLLASAGKSTEAAPWLRLAKNSGRLLPEEKQLLDTALAQINDHPN